MRERRSAEKQQTRARATHSLRVVVLSQNRRVKFSGLTFLFVFHIGIPIWEQVNLNPDLYFLGLIRF